MQIKSLSLAIVALALLASTGIARADSISVQNASFEVTAPLNIACGAGCAYNWGAIPDWQGGGSFQPSATYFNPAGVTGSIVAFTNGGTISQTLTASLQPNSIYTLLVDVGQRLDMMTTDYSISLFAGGTLLNSISGSNGVITPGTFATQTLTYSTADAVVPGNLSIVLSSAGAQSDFDNVRLDASAIATPESSSLMLLGVGLLGLLAIGSRFPSPASIIAA